MLKFWRSKKAETPPVAASTPTGGLFALEPKPDDRIQRGLMAQSRVFQRKASQDAIEGVAMDSAFSGGDSAYMLRSNVMPLNIAEWYASQSFIGFQMCATIAQNRMVDKACSMPARDAVRNGWDVTQNNGEALTTEVLSYIKRRDQELRISDNLVEFVRMGRVFGIRIAMFKVASDDPQYYEKPFNPDGITPGSYKGIAQIDPYWVAPQLDSAAVADPTSINFYEPTWWVISGVKVHRSHLVIFRGPEVADVLKPSYQYAGMSIPQVVYERVYAAERTANEAPLLAMSKRIRVLKTDIAAAVAQEGGMEAALGAQSQYLNNYGTLVLDNADEYAHHDTGLADFDALTMTQYQLVAALANVPATKLLGTTPKGFNSTGEFEEASYHEELASIQANDMQRVLDRNYLCLTRSELEPKFGQKFDLQVTWRALDEPTGKEIAEINYLKAQTAAELAGIGAIDGEDERQRLIADPDSGYTGMESGAPDDGLLDELMSGLEDGAAY